MTQDMIDLGPHDWQDVQGNITDQYHLWYCPDNDRMYKAATANDTPQQLDPSAPGSGKYHSDYVRGRMLAGKCRWVQTKVQIEDGPEYDCWLIQEDTWNGWARPHFTKEVSDKIMVDFNASSSESKIRYDAQQDEFVYEDPVNYPGEAENIPGEDIEGKHLYGLGAGSWIWSEVEGGHDDAATP